MTNTEQARQGHGWWPYLLPYAAFMVVGMAGKHLPDSLAPVLLFVKPAVPAALLIYFAMKGSYPELRGTLGKPVWVGADLLLGIALAALWVVPFVFFPSCLVFDWMKPDTSGGFNPEILGTGLVTLALGARLIGYALVTPFFEELFVRSFVMRSAEVFQDHGDFRTVPVAKFALRGFITTLVVFTFTHEPWEYAVMLLWALVTNLWYYYRGNLWSVIIAHAATNAAILIFASLYNEHFTHPDGSPMLLWFFI